MRKDICVGECGYQDEWMGVCVTEVEMGMRDGGFQIVS